MVTQGVILSGRYLIRNEIAIGGMGAVYEATDLRTGGPVAVKVLHPVYAHNEQFISRLRREAQIAASIRTPRAVRVLDLDEHEGITYLVMEYVPGETLDEVISRRGRIPLADALSICIDITRALEGAHAVGVVHRDLKPANVKITDEGEVKVLDFGIARAENLPGITSTDMFTGTPEYCAPERVDGKGDIRSDIYSLGVMLYEMLSGQRPFDGPTPFAILRQHESATVPSLPIRVPHEVQTILERCLAKRPADRFQTPYDLMGALRAARDAIGQTPRETQPPVAPTLLASDRRANGVAATVAAAPEPAVPVTAPGAGESPPAAEVPPAARSSRRLFLAAGGAVLALLVLGGAAFGLSRRGGSDAASGEAAAPTPAVSAQPSSTPAVAVVSATPEEVAPAAAPLLLPGQKLALDISDEAALPVCLGPGNRPQVKTVLHITSIERDATDRGKVTVSYDRSVPRIPGVECPLRYDPDATGNVISLETLQRTPTRDRTLRAFSVNGSGLSVTGASNIYGAMNLPGTWVFEGVELNGVSLTLVQQTQDGRELHRVTLLPPR